MTGGNLTSRGKYVADATPVSSIDQVAVLLYINDYKYGLWNQTK